MEYTIEYQIDLSGLKDFVEQAEARGLFTATQESVETSGKHLINTWIRNANTAFTHSKGEYVRSIVDGAEYPYKGDPLSFYVRNASPYAASVEFGWDLKQLLNTSNKVRMNKKGEKYLIIPFRHGVPGTTGFQPMPKDIYKHAKELDASHITGKFKEGSIKGATTLRDAEFLRQNNDVKVTRNTYKWGGKIEMEDKKSIYHNMYRFEKNPHIFRNSPANKIAGLTLGKFVYTNITPASENQSSNYITFRVIKENHTGWTKPGMFLLQKTVQEVEPAIRQLIGEAVTDDFNNLMSMI